MKLMKDPTFWTDPEKLIEYLGSQLVSGRLALLLGAGVSRDFGLPDWKTLLQRMSDQADMDPLKDGDNLPRRAQAIKDGMMKGDLEKFLNLVHASLYESASIDFEYLTTHRLLASIGSLVMSSRRGSASNVVTLNFDDVLETYLEYFGFDVASITDEKHWAPNCDVAVYHPHGFLPFSLERRRSGDIVLSSRDFFRMIDNDSRNGWRQLLVTLLRTHTFLHIGLSGDDLNLGSLMNNVEGLHAAKGQAAYNGVRFSVVGDGFNPDLAQEYQSYGVFTHSLGAWNQLPAFLFGICQAARTQRVKLDTL